MRKSLLASAKPRLTDTSLTVLWAWRSLLFLWLGLWLGLSDLYSQFSELFLEAAAGVHPGESADRDDGPGTGRRGHGPDEHPAPPHEERQQQPGECQDGEHEGRHLAWVVGDLQRHPLLHADEGDRSLAAWQRPRLTGQQ